MPYKHPTYAIVCDLSSCEENLVPVKAPPDQQHAALKGPVKDSFHTDSPTQWQFQLRVARKEKHKAWP